MNITITKQTESPLLSRKRITADVSFKGQTPSKAVIKKELASKLKTKEDLVEIRHIYGKFGEEKAKVIANVYEDEKVMKALIHKKKEKTEKKEAAPKAEAKPTETAKPTKEEKKQTSKEQPKKEEKPTKQLKPAKKTKEETKDKEKKEEKK